VSDYVRTAGDTVHTFSAQLTDANGPIQIIPGSTATIEARLLGGLTPTIAAPAVILEAGAPVGDANRGVVYYNVQPSDVATPGIDLVKWRINPAGAGPSTVQSFPEDGYMWLVLLPTT
jgi:hypothetical protein